MDSTILNNNNNTTANPAYSIEDQSYSGLQPGTVLHNNYRIIRMLGQGGFGITYLAHDIALDRKVAIKEFFPQTLCDRNEWTSQVVVNTQNSVVLFHKLKNKFIKEARNIARFDNPNIIKIHTAFEENDTAYYVMDFIEGESLSSIVARNGGLPANQALGYITEVGNALEYVHHHRINHLDVKPANIMLRRSDNRAILIDFGLSKQYDSDGKQTSTTITGVSHGYAPMEQYYTGGLQEFSPGTDLYALAATLYYILSGVEPLPAMRLLNEELTFPSSIPQKLIGPIRKAMSGAMRDRHESVRQFLDEINGRSKSGKQKKNTTESTSQSKKKLFSFIGIGIVVVAIVVAGIAILSNRESSDTTDTNAGDLPTVVRNSVEPAKTVEGMYYESSLGACSYTGEVNEEGQPDGKGRAEWTSGIGKYYDGEWSDGKMDGECEYANKDGYTFKGEFKDNHYSKGRLTNPDGSYYEGTFDKNGMKWTGTEYAKNGTATDTWTNGK